MEQRLKLIENEQMRMVELLKIMSENIKRLQNDNNTKK